MREAREAAPRGAGLVKLWRDRPLNYSRPLWLIALALDLLPYPWGEETLARLLWIVALVRPARRRPAFAWAAALTGRRSRRLALAACAFRGRWVARSLLIGVRGPRDFARRVVVHGANHLADASGRGTILLGFHLGPPNTDVALRVLGHPAAFLGTARRSRAWASPAWRALIDPRDTLSPPEEPTRFWVGYLHRARRLLLEGRNLYIMADSWVGRELFRIALPGCELIVRAGWLSLWRQTGARVVPVTARLDGRVQIITIHPPLPAAGREPDAHLGASRAILTRIVEDYVARWPAQCPALIFPPEHARLAAGPGGVRRPLQLSRALARDASACEVDPP
jgi:lauroyl/myristoyl acyltransferase